MRTYTLLARNLAWYWRTNLAVLLGVAVAGGVLGGAILVGESVRVTLRNLVIERLGDTDSIVTGNAFFREDLAAALQPAAPAIALDGVVENERTGKRSAAAEVYGVQWGGPPGPRPTPWSASGVILWPTNWTPTPETRSYSAFPNPRPSRSSPYMAEKTT